MGQIEGSFGLKRAESRVLKEAKVLMVACSNDHKAQDTMNHNFKKLGIPYEAIYLCRTDVWANNFKGLRK